MTVRELIKHLEAMPGHLHVVCNAGPVRTIEHLPTPIRTIEHLPTKDWVRGTHERGIVVLSGPTRGEVFATSKDIPAGRMIHGEGD